MATVGRVVQNPSPSLPSKGTTPQTARLSYSKMADDEYDPTQDDDVASDHLDDEDAPGPSKRKAAATGTGAKDDVRPSYLSGLHMNRM